MKHFSARVDLTRRSIKAQVLQKIFQNLLNGPDQGIRFLFSVLFRVSSQKHLEEKFVVRVFGSLFLRNSRHINTVSYFNNLFVYVWYFNNLPETIA